MTYTEFLEDVLGLQVGLMTIYQAKDAEAAYAEYCKKSTARKQWKAGAKVLAARQAAALFGGKALTGSTKQKEWGEQIRLEKISGKFYSPYHKDEMTEAQIVLACNPAGLGASAHFWIENREKDPSVIGKFFSEARQLRENHKAAKAAGNAAEAAALAAKYNDLTAQFGFK